MEKITKTAHGMNGYVYPFILGENYYCIPTCIEMIISSMGYTIDTEALRTHFQIITSNDTNQDHELGVQLTDGDLDALFSTLHIPMYEQFIPINKIAEYQFEYLLKELLDSGAHILCGYSYGCLFGDDRLRDIGHASILLSIHNSFVQILNPGPKNAGINTVREDDLYAAIRYRHGGLWVLSPK